MNLPEIPPIAILVVTAVLGYFGGYLSYKQKVKSENINAKRDRLLKFILKAEDFLSVLVEISYLNADIVKKEELVDSLKTNQELYGKEYSHLSDEVSNINDELKNELNPQAKKEYINRLKSISLRLSEIEQELKIINRTYEQKIPEIKRMKENSENLLNRIITDDIGSTSYMIDPSRELVKYLFELQSICTDPTRQYYSDARVIELRGKINQFFNKQIDKIA